MKIVYAYCSVWASPWNVSKYASALLDGAADVQLIEAGFKNVQIKGLHDGRIPVRRFQADSASRIRFFANVAKASMALLKTRADCYISGDPLMLGVAAIAAKFRGARLVYIPFEYFPHVSSGSALRLKFWRCLERVCARSVSSWISLGEKLADEYRNVYPLGDKVHVVYSAWPAQRELPKPVLRQKLGLRPGQRIVLYQGIIASKRGLLNVVDAFKLLPENVVFVMLGYGAAVRLIRRKIDELNLTERIYILDAVSHDELIRHTCGADIGILPILNVCRSYELCNPGKLFQYMAAGLPIAASNLPQLEWFIRTRGLGRVFDPDDPADIARTLRYLLDHEEFRAQCAHNSRETHLNETCWELQAARLRAAVLDQDGE